MKESNYRTSVLTDWVVALMLVGSLGIRPGIAEVANEDPHVEEEDHDEDGHEDGREDGHEEHQGEDVVRLHAEAIREFGIEIGEAGPGGLAKYTRLQGEVVIDPDRLVHVVPRVSGVAREVYKRLGDQVKRGDVLAELESRELAELKSTYLVARERFGLAEKTFTREEKLWLEAISSERDYLAAEQNLAEQRIEMRAAEQKLHALGFSNAYLQALTFDEDEYFTRYELRASLQGTVIEKHISLGEVIKDDAEAFVIADLNLVWVKLTVYQKDLSSVRPGQSVRISKEDGSTVTGKISYVSPVVDELTRTAVARLELKNENGQWRPGSFVAGLVAVEARSVPLLIRKSALQTIEDEMVVFVETPEGFEPQKVRVGRGNEVEVEIVAGLAAGQRYVVEGAFTLKAELAKGSFGDGHNH